jgi:hypothetical protein
MAGIPSWRQQLTQNYSGARKWGTGINPIHASTDDGTGRVLAPGDAPYGLPPDSPLIAEQYGYCVEDLAATGNFNFMEEHPNWDEDAQRGSSDLPAWGHRHGPPSGTRLRTLKRGMSEKETEAQQNPNETVSEGWTNKQHGAVLDSLQSDPAQLYVQASSTQRDETRVNTAAQLRGTDAERSSIGSRIPGMKVKNFSTGQRLDDMTPWTQDLIWRVFTVRTAGTGDPVAMQPNEMYVSQPMQREVPADVYQGDSETSGNYGYADGDYYV